MKWASALLQYKRAQRLVSARKLYVSFSFTLMLWEFRICAREPSQIILNVSLDRGWLHCTYVKGFIPLAIYVLDPNLSVKRVTVHSIIKQIAGRIIAPTTDAIVAGDETQPTANNRTITVTIIGFRLRPVCATVFLSAR